VTRFAPVLGGVYAMAGVYVNGSGHRRTTGSLVISKWTRLALPSGAVVATALAAMGAASAQDLTNTTPFTANAPYIGDVLSNTSTIDNNAAAPGWQGDIVANSNFINNNAGATWSGDILSNVQTINNFAGASWFGSVSTAGDLKNFGTWSGDVLFNSEKIENHVGAVWTGDVYGNTHKFLNYGNWVGDLVAQGSTGELNSYGDWLGDVLGNDGTIYNDGVWTGDIQTNSYRIINNLLDTTSTETLWLGDVLTNDGTIINYINATWQGDVVDNAGKISNYNFWNGNLNNRGIAANTGIWTGNVLNTGTVFSARNQFIGNFDNRGAVQLTGDLSISGLFTNSGRLQLTETAGVQTLTVGTAEFGTTASYEIEVTAIGETDLMLVTGTARLGGIVTVKTSTIGGGTFDDQKAYTILTAGSIEGDFDEVTADLAFLSPHLSYDANNVYLGLRRNDVGFADTGATGNQVAVAAAAEALGPQNPIYDAILWLAPSEAQNAFDQLSGEVFGVSANAALLGAGTVADFSLSRLGRGGSSVSDDKEDGDQIWAQAYGAGMASGSGIAALDGRTGGFAFGRDGQLGDWRVGALVKLGMSASSVPELTSRIDSTDLGAGLYAGTAWGQTQLSLGGAYTLHDTQSSRIVDFPGFADVLSGNYLADTTQAFAELSQAFDLGAATLTPFAGLSYVRYATEGFVEDGGPAALTRDAYAVDAVFATLGVGVEQSFDLGEDRSLTARASLGWRGAYGDASTSRNALDGAPAFTVTSAPLSGDLTIVSAGVDIDVNATTDLDLSYDGQFGSLGDTHSVRGTWATSF
jgi:uncharacterized protein with beta-barrel porin domain